MPPRFDMVEHTGIEPVIVCITQYKNRLFSVLCGLFDVGCPPLKAQSVPKNVTKVRYNISALFEGLLYPS